MWGAGVGEGEDPLIRMWAAVSTWGINLSPSSPSPSPSAPFPSPSSSSSATVFSSVFPVAISEPPAPPTLWEYQQEDIFYALPLFFFILLTLLTMIALAVRRFGASGFMRSAYRRSAPRLQEVSAELFSSSRRLLRRTPGLRIVNRLFLLSPAQVQEALSPSRFPILARERGPDTPPAGSTQVVVLDGIVLEDDGIVLL